MHWPILIVDDDPDVLSLTRLALRRVEVLGWPLGLVTAGSGAEALDKVAAIQKDSVHPLPAAAVAIVDVVMETDAAGLEVCRALRRRQRNDLTQLVIRTGQPGLAPEREVIEGFDINGYYGKHEATEERLVSLVTGGVRQYYLMWSALLFHRMTGALIEHAGDSERLSSFVGTTYLPEVPGQRRAPFHVFMDGASIGGTLDKAEARLHLSRLSNYPTEPLGRSGASYAVDSEHTRLLTVRTKTGALGAQYLLQATLPAPLSVRTHAAAFWESFTYLWRRATGEGVEP